MAGDKDITRSDLEYDLPADLIAQKPLGTRSESRLLVASRDTESLTETTFSRLPELLAHGDLLVMNNTRVFRARLCGTRTDTGGKTEVFLLFRLGDDIWKALLRPGKRGQPGMRFVFEKGLRAVVRESLGNGKAVIQFESDSGNISELLNDVGQVPLPPYIKRSPEELDNERYQTVYAQQTGAVAAPTAGLHFDETVFSELEKAGIEKTFITLHVGPGTFQPLRFEELKNNRLEPEVYSVSRDSLERIRQAKLLGRRITAVGTTTTRVMESIDLDASEHLEGETDLFIYPPFRFHVVDTLITNFHLPQSSLLGLVAAFMGLSFMKKAYRLAIERRFRFYSYGDAMLIL